MNSIQIHSVSYGSPQEDITDIQLSSLFEYPYTSGQAVLPNLLCALYTRFQASTSVQVDSSLPTFIEIVPSSRVKNYQNTLRKIPEEQTHLLHQFHLSFKRYSCINEIGNFSESRLNLAGTPGPATARRECLKNGRPNHTQILKPLLPRGVAAFASKSPLRVTCEATPVPQFVTPDLSATRHFVSGPCDHSISSSSFSVSIAFS
jgi:hypothetical protein